MSYSGTSDFLSFVSFLVWLNEQWISSLVEKDLSDRLGVRGPYSRSCSEKENVAVTPTELSGNQKSGSIFALSSHSFCIVETNIFFFYHRTAHQLLAQGLRYSAGVRYRVLA